MALRKELLKSIWYAFTALDVEKSGKVSKSQLKVEYLLKKLLGSLSLEMGLGKLEELLAQDAQSAQTAVGLSVWQFLELFNSGRCLRGVGRDSLSMAIQEVYQELIQDVLKQGYLWKRGHLRRNWAERWFQLQPSSLCYFGSEECKEKRGTIPLDAHCCVEVLPDREGKRCMFCVKTASRTYEMSASDTRQRQEWTAAIQTAIRLQAEGKTSLHKDLKQKQQQLEEVRQNRQRADEDVEAAQRKLRQASTNVKHWNVQMNRLMHPIEPGDKRPTTSSSFTGFQPPPLARRDSSLKRLTRWGSQGNRTLSVNSSEQKSLNGGDETPILALASQEEKLDPAPGN